VTAVSVQDYATLNACLILKKKKERTNKQICISSKTPVTLAPTAIHIVQISRLQYKDKTFWCVFHISWIYKINKKNETLLTSLAAPDTC
jgi:hypothetical protein